MMKNWAVCVLDNVIFAYYVLTTLNIYCKQNAYTSGEKKTDTKIIMEKGFIINTLSERT